LSIALNGADTWTLRKMEHKYLKILKFGAAEVWRRAIAPFLWETKCYVESKRKGTFYSQ